MSSPILNDVIPSNARDLGFCRGLHTCQHRQQPRSLASLRDDNLGAKLPAGRRRYRVVQKSSGRLLLTRVAIKLRLEFYVIQRRRFAFVGTALDADHISLPQVQLNGVACGSVAIHGV